MRSRYGSLDKIQKAHYTQTMKKTAVKTTFIIGHKNPDTDSVVSAAAYHDFKSKTGFPNCKAARAGKPTPQTEYIFSRFGVELPELLSDLIPRVKHYYNDKPVTINKNASIWEAFNIMNQAGIRFLPVVDDEGCYHSAMHFVLFTENIFKITRPKQKTVIETSIDFLANVIGAKKILTSNEREIKKSPVIIGAASIETFSEHLKADYAKDSIVICGNRKSIQEHAVKSGVRLLIVTTDNEPDDEIKHIAKEHGVSILLSPYDTTSTALLLIYAMPVSAFSSTSVEAVKLSDTVQSAKSKLGQTPAKTLAVVNETGKVVGTFSESDAYGEANINTILVDHNEISQSVDGLQNFDIIEVIDHHRLGNLPTKFPITFINYPVGATCTIIANLYFDRAVPLDLPIAGILLCGILADTLILQSATTTALDKNTAEKLAQITGLNIRELGTELMKAASNIAGRSSEELVHQDLKAYSEDGAAYTVSQIEVENLGQILERKDEIIAVLENIRKDGDKLFSSLMITDITKLSSILLISCKGDFEKAIKLPQEDGIFQLHNIVSRKKQLLPMLSEIVKQYMLA